MVVIGPEPRTAAWKIRWAFEISEVDRLKLQTQDSYLAKEDRHGDKACPQTRIDSSDWTPRNGQRKAATSRTRRQPPPPRPRRARREKELVDDPRRRYQELMADRHFGTDPEVNLAELRRMAVAQVAAMAPVNETPTTPATPGASNWVPLGPLAIVNGQTYGGARVIVTGRVTEIVPHPTDPLTIYVATARGIWKPPTVA